MKYTFLKLLLSVAILLGPVSMLQAASIFKSPFLDSEITQPLAIVMLIVIALLLCVIGALGKVLMVSIGIYKKRIGDKKETTNINGLLWIGLASLTMVPFDSFAQEATATVAKTAPLIGGLSQVSFYFLFGIIILEVIVILVLLSVFYVLMGSKKEQKEKSAAKKIHWIEKINAAPSAKGVSDADISMGHDFDGIEELDNPTPPWWRWGFVLTLVVSLIYLWRYEIAQTAPNQYQELAIHTEHAEAAVKAYLAKSAANVDENTVTFLNDESNLSAGKAVFIQMCAACHGQEGGGNAVGPNLTDNYWLHGGAINDIFKTIKYGVTEKGMKSWKDDFSPVQIAQLASYIKSLKGTTPIEAKAPQGELYEEGATNDASGATTSTDSVSVAIITKQ